MSAYILAETSHIIKDVYEKRDFSIKLKGEDDPFTQADLKAQSLISYSYRKFFKGLLVKGEEKEELLSEPTYFDYSKVRLDLVPESLFGESNILNISDLIVWVDPLDGTSDFLKGDLECITTLVGISSKGVAHAGVVCRMFDQTKDGYNFKPRIYFGVKGVSKVFQLNLTDIEKEKITELTRPPVKVGDK